MLRIYSPLEPIAVPNSDIQPSCSLCRIANGVAVLQRFASERFQYSYSVPCINCFFFVSYGPLFFVIMDVSMHSNVYQKAYTTVTLTDTVLLPLFAVRLHHR